MTVQTTSRLTVIRAGGTLALNIMFRLGKMNGEATLRNATEAILSAAVDPGEHLMSDSTNRFLTLLKARGH